MTRPSPTQSATLFKKGERKIGNDGNMWEIIVDKNGRHRWKKVSGRKISRRQKTSRKTSRRQKTSRKTSRRQKTSRKTSRRQKTSQAKHYILFTEPAIWIQKHEQKDIQRAKQGKNLLIGPVIQVTSSFLKVLKKAPKKGKCLSDKYGNAYIFGKKFPSYRLIGYHGNDMAQTGLIEVSKWEEYHGKLRSPPNYWEKAYPKWDWDNRQGLKKIQAIYPGVLFVGETVGGDVGANLWGHYNSKGELDGLIIDNDCLFNY